MWQITTPPENVMWTKGKELFNWLFGYEDTDPNEYLGIPGVSYAFDKMDADDN